MPLSPKAKFWMALGVVVLVHTFFWLKLQSLHRSDPDTFTYLALARETALKGPLTKLPQVEDLGWGKSFADKNLVFNVVNGLFYQVGGERGVLFSLYLMSLGVVVALLFGVARFLPAHWAAFVVTATYLNASFVIRLFLLRPHVWAMACFVALLVSLLYRAPRMALIFAALFGWGYPMYTLPLGLLVAAAIFFNYQYNNPLMKKACLFGLVGLVVSMICHPGFPANLGWSHTISDVAVNGMAVGTQNLPIENTPPRADVFFKRFFVFFMFLLSAFALEAYLPRPWKSEEKRMEYFFLAIISIGLWSLAFFQPRAAEYAIPCTIMFIGFALSRWIELVPNPRHLAAAFAFAMFAGNIHSIVDFYAKGAKFSLDPAVPIGAIDSLPKEAGGKKVFNCEWEAGAFLLYRRPDVRFVDILDPTFLERANPNLAAQRRLLFDGKLLPYPVIHEQFGADYVICREPELIARLDQDPFFVRLFPAPGLTHALHIAGYSAVYAVNPETHKHFVAKMMTFPEPENGRSLASSVNLTPQAQTTPFWNLLPYAKNGAADRYCFDMTVPKEEMARFNGSDWLGVGGGPRVEVWWNGSPLFSGKDNDNSLDYLREWIPLPRKVQSGDVTKFKVCTRKEDGYHGLAVSFWKDKELKDICHSRGYADEGTKKTQWRYVIADDTHCLGRVARSQ